MMKAKGERSSEESVWGMRLVPTWERKPHTPMRKCETLQGTLTEGCKPGSGGKTAASAEPLKTNYADKELKVKLTNIRTQRSEVYGDAHEWVLMHLRPARTSSPSPPPSSTPVPRPSVPWNQVLQQVSVPPQQPTLLWPTKVLSMGVPVHSHPSHQSGLHHTLINLPYCSAYFSSWQSDALRIHFRF